MREIVPLLQTIIKSINELNEDDYYKLIEGKGKLVFKENGNKVTVKKNLEIEKYKQQLELLDDREDAYHLLKDLKKVDLLDFAEEYHVYALKNDKKDIIIEKIIEAFIGVKLRFKAMKALDLSYKIIK
jgi:hypothetical protein